MHLPKVLRGTGVRFAILHTLVFVVLVAVIGWTAERMVTAALERQARGRVENEALTLANEYAQEGRGGLLSAVKERHGTRSNGLHYAVIDRDGRVLAGDEGLAHGPSPAGEPTAVIRSTSGDPPDSTLIATRMLEDGSRLVVADDLEALDHIENVVSGAFLAALGLAVGLGLAAGAALTRSLLRRVEAISRTADAIIAGDLSRRVDLNGSGDDFDHLAATLNAMLDRISGLMNNLRQVTNDIAHDLRTPLARLRQGLEDARDHAVTAGDYRSFVERAIGEADGLLDTFSALLRIAEIEASARRSAFRPVDLSEVMRNVAEAYAPVAEDEGRPFEAHIAGDLRVHGDRELLVQLFANLVENALHHTPKGTPVRMKLERNGADASIRAEVTDAGPGVPGEERSRIFRRFYRLDLSRTSPGNGLGLSMVAAIAELHRAAVEVLDNQPGLRVAVVFPWRATTAIEPRL